MSEGSKDGWFEWLLSLPSVKSLIGYLPGFFLTVFAGIQLLVNSSTHPISGITCKCSHECILKAPGSAPQGNDLNSKHHVTVCQIETRNYGPGLLEDMKMQVEIKDLLIADAFESGLICEPTGGGEMKITKLTGSNGTQITCTPTVNGNSNMLHPQSHFGLRFISVKDDWSESNIKSALLFQPGQPPTDIKVAMPTEISLFQKAINAFHFWSPWVGIMLAILAIIAFKSQNRLHAMVTKRAVSEVKQELEEAYMETRNPNSETKIPMVDQVPTELKQAVVKPQGKGNGKRNQSG